MKWTKHAPNVSGFYWLRTKINDCVGFEYTIRQFIPEIINGQDCGLSAVGHHLSPKEYRKYGYEFLGPITPEHTLTFKGEK
jgi:hypothetical protein